MTEAKMPDALRLSGLHEFCNLLNLQTFVGRIRRSRRIRHGQSALCQQYEADFFRLFNPQHIPASYSQSFFIL
ncbi:hypothetical protein BGC82_003157 [Escherichia coli]|jgi:hypothetical protein|nr:MULTISPECIES: hypothetical protein [Enterobacteriaceae]EFO57047.1 hypothetical protein HMPREF9348_03858 [Escherichia coli MS 145-7]MBU5657683.1 hypothetical protein [Escherichia sp. S2_ASV_4]EEC7886548.1 hypothetical protein [Escherichia coli]EED1284408.1 hypothetical protein [Escherichia coli]EEQ9123426.1 hypothetical protein [Escherichia coli]